MRDRRRLRLGKRIGSRLGISLSGLASRGGPVWIKRIGRLVGNLHYWMSWPTTRRLRRDIARALGVSAREAGAILHGAFCDNDRAVFEVVSLAQPKCDPDALLDTVRIEEMARLEGFKSDGRGVILLGMHMGNGILMAGRLARSGFPVHVVFRDPRRLPPGLLARSIERAGCMPLPLDRKNPTRSFRQMLKVLSSGGMLYVLMDQANKGEGAGRRLLGKTLRMPSGIPSLAVRTDTPVLPVHAEAAEPEWLFRVYPPLVADTSEGMLDEMMESMQAQIIRYPALWSWHHRRWRRYHFDS